LRHGSNSIQRTSFSADPIAESIVEEFVDSPLSEPEPRGSLERQPSADKLMSDATPQGSVAPAVSRAEPIKLISLAKAIE
jgi:hypothetical protein